MFPTSCLKEGKKVGSYGAMAAEIIQVGFAKIKLIIGMIDGSSLVTLFILYAIT